MSTDTEHHRPSFRFRDKFSRLKDRVKDKIHDKSIKHNVTLFIHQNLTSNDTNDNNSRGGSRHGFRQQMHHVKDVLKNKTHYTDIKDKITDKFDDKFGSHHNETYPKGFYDSLFSPETENDHYFQTAIICLWVIAVLCIIPTIIIIFLPSKKPNTTSKKPTNTSKSTNMIFFHIFFCELCYLSYILLAMINVAKDFQLGSTLCDYANYGMYVTIPIMQFALLFLSLDRLTKHFHLSMTWTKIFTIPYLVQVILCGIWIFLIALLVTFMFIKKQFNFSFVKDQVNRLAPPIFGDVVSKIVSRRHHCSIDGRLSSVFKTLIIVLFIILIVKPIILSIGFNLLTPCCCKNKQNTHVNYGDRRITKLVTIFLLLNFFFSFPFYFTSMFKSIFTNIDSTKDTFTIILKIVFVLRLTNIIFECLAFYIFERNSWNLMTKLFYYCTCKKFSIFNRKSDDDIPYTKDPGVLAIIKRTGDSDIQEDDDNIEEIKTTPKKKRKNKNKKEPTTESEHDDDDDDGGMSKKTNKRSIIEKAETPVESNDEAPVIKRKKKSNKKTVEINEDEQQKIITTKRKSQIQQQESDEDENENENENETKKIIKSKKRKSRSKKPVSDNEEHETITNPRRKSRPKGENEEEEEEKFIDKRKSSPNDVEFRIPNGGSTSHRRSTDKNNTKHRTTPSPTESEDDAASNASQTSPKINKPVRKQKRTRTNSPNDQHSQHRTELLPSSRPRMKPKTSTHSHHSKNKSQHGTTTKKTAHNRRKKSKKDPQTRILEMSDEV